MKDSRKAFAFRKKRVRMKIAGTSARPRLSVYRGHKHIYAQLIDDENGRTIVATSTLSADLKGKHKVMDTIPAAQSVGESIGRKAVEKGIKKVVFDRGGHMYSGRIKALADAARKAGLEF